MTINQCLFFTLLAQRADPAYGDILAVGKDMIRYGNGWDSVISRQKVISYFKNVLRENHSTSGKRGWDLDGVDRPKKRLRAGNIGSSDWMTQQRLADWSDRSRSGQGGESRAEGEGSMINAPITYGRAKGNPEQSTEKKGAWTSGMESRGGTEVGYGREGLAAFQTPGARQLGGGGYGLQRFNLASKVDQMTRGFSSADSHPKSSLMYAKTNRESST